MEDGLPREKASDSAWPPVGDEVYLRQSARSGSQGCPKHECRVERRPGTGEPVELAAPASGTTR